MKETIPHDGESYFIFQKARSLYKYLENNGEKVLLSMQEITPKLALQLQEIKNENNLKII